MSTLGIAAHEIKREHNRARRMSERWDAWKDSYDGWKLASLPDYDWEHEPEVLCVACMDVGWMLDEWLAVPCSECSEPVALTDLLEANP